MKLVEREREKDHPEKSDSRELFQQRWGRWTQWIREYRGS